MICVAVRKSPTETTENGAHFHLLGLKTAVIAL